MGKYSGWVWVLLAAVAGCGLGYWLLGGGPGPVPSAVSPPTALAQNCAGGPAGAAAANRSGMASLVFAPFHRPEIGWATYAPLVAHEIGTPCDGASPGFAARLAAWQVAHRLPATGVMDVTTFGAMKAIWDRRRPFEAASRIACPAPPDPASLAVVPAAQSYGGKRLLLRPGALAAYERLWTAARASLPAMRTDPRLMSLFSAFRSPAEDDARCAREGNCEGVVRASCSAHRTGLAMDIFLGAAPGFDPASSADANRLYISRGPAYRWLVANAGRFGFVNYAFEPWHWEWTGEAI
ncbi:MAG: D-alanyl-D-alanine carboxypeptidase family protein [Caulobacteraceae bacterium]